MTWFGWTLVALFASSALASVSQTGKERKPLDNATVVLIVAIDALLILGVLLVGTS